MYVPSRKTDVTNDATSDLPDTVGRMSDILTAAKNNQVSRKEGRGEGWKQGHAFRQLPSLRRPPFMRRPPATALMIKIAYLPLPSFSPPTGRGSHSHAVTRLLQRRNTNRRCVNTGRSLRSLMYLVLFLSHKQRGIVYGVPPE